MYNISSSTNIWFTSAYLIVSVVINIPVSLFIAKISLRKTAGIALLFSIAGSFFRIFINSSYPIAFFGQYLMACSYPFFLSSTSKFSAVWFPPDQVILTLSQRAISTSINASIVFAFTQISLVTPTLAIDREPIPTNLEENYRQRLKLYFQIYTILTILIGLPALLCLRAKPAYSSSPTSDISR